MTQLNIDELNARIMALQKYLAANDIDTAILSQSSDIYYYSGSLQPLYLVVPASSEPFVLARKATTRISIDSPHIAIDRFTNGKELAASIAGRGLERAHRIGLTLDTLSYTSANRLAKLFPNAELVNIAWDLRMMRAVKSESEIATQAKAGEIMAKVPDIVKASLTPGMTELELSTMVESYFRLNGHAVVVRSRREEVGAIAFGVCSSGKNSLAGNKFEGICAGAGLSAGSAYGASKDVIESGVPIILDFAFNLDGYIVDQTRMASIGQPSNQVLKAYEDMAQIEEKLASMLLVGTAWEDIYFRAVEDANAAGYFDTFMGMEPERVGFIGHGVGLELDEPPFIAPKMKFPLEAGMVLALEPKVSLPGVGVIGIEDTYIVENDGARPITLADRDFIIV